MDFMDFSRRLYRWASEGVDMYANVFARPHQIFRTGCVKHSLVGRESEWYISGP